MFWTIVGAVVIAWMITRMMSFVWQVFGLGAVVVALIEGRLK